MHEMGVTRNLVDSVIATTERYGASEVKTVYLSIGFVRDIVDEILEECFRWMARGTIAENAELIIERIPFTVRCNDCGTIYPLDGHDESTWVCPGCGERHYTLNTGMEFKITNLELGFPEDMRQRKTA